MSGECRSYSHYISIYFLLLNRVLCVKNSFFTSMSLKTDECHVVSVKKLKNMIRNGKKVILLTRYKKSYLKIVCSNVNNRKIYAENFSFLIFS